MFHCLSEHSPFLKDTGLYFECYDCFPSLIQVLLLPKSASVEHLSWQYCVQKNTTILLPKHIGERTTDERDFFEQKMLGCSSQINLTVGLNF